MHGRGGLFRSHRRIAGQKMRTIVVCLRGFGWVFYGRGVVAEVRLLGRSVEEDLKGWRIMKRDAGGEDYIETGEAGAVRSGTGTFFWDVIAGGEIVAIGIAAGAVRLGVDEGSGGRCDAAEGDECESQQEHGQYAVRSLFHCHTLCSFPCCCQALSNQTRAHFPLDNRANFPLCNL